MKKAFVGVGIGVMVVTGLIQSGVVDVNEKLGQPSLSSIPAASDHSQAEKQAVQPTINESGWGKVATKTCEVAWNNQDFKDGWCDLGEYPAGEYRFEVKSLLTKVRKGQDGVTHVPPEGFPLSAFFHNKVFTDYVKTYYPLPTERIWGVILKKDSSEQIFNSSSSITIREGDSLLASINFLNMEKNWQVLGFNGKITIKILKKT